jgi:peptidylprolyl isomerase
MSDQVQTTAPGGTTAQQPTATERAVAAKRRGQALIGAAAGIAVIAVLIGVFVYVQRSGGTRADAPAAASSPLAPRPAQPTEAPAPTGPPAPADPGQVAIPPALKTKPVVKAGSGTLTELKVTPLTLGTGPAVAKGQTITVNYVGVVFKTGQEFDSSWKRKEPFVTQIGVGGVIPGWDQGLIGAPVGTRVQLDIPAQLAYGENPGGGRPGGALRFVVDVLAAQ